MTEWTILDQAHTALRQAVAGIPQDGWQLTTPCSEWTVTQVFQHAVGDQLGYASFLSDTPRPEEDPFAPSGTLSAPAGDLLDNALQAASSAWAAVDRDAQDVPVPVPPFNLPAPVGAGACALDAAVHAWDIAVATGRPSPLTADLARDLLPIAQQIVEGPRAYGYFAAALEPETGDDAVATLLRYLGRTPTWTR
ncbi:TIGR03086 family metal-binding protein [Nonomuraea typhae]|uniref:TIGR03086 family metal-binding protein n=1 Tax=Nonomuraea typhae TaxID=2603600 RepID=UPI0012F95DF1|nr:TIGR03086 family metal-binding protein [Nonomuraea typhae]